MSGWFGTSNRETNNALDGISAGYARRKNMQKQRYSPMGRVTIDQMAEQNRSKPAVTMIPGGDKQAYKTFTLTSTFNSGLNKWVTSGRKGLKTFNATGRSKGESVNAVKNKIDASLGQDKNKMSMFTDASSESIREVTVTDPGEVARFNRAKAAAEAASQFKPVPMPKDFNTGTYTVRAVYGERNKTYTVSVIQGTIVKEVATFAQSQGQAAVVKHTQLKSLATKKFIYEGQKPQSVQKTNYNIDLQVVQAMPGLSGIFDGVLGMLGLGRMTIDQMATQNTGGAPPPVGTQVPYPNWSAMPAKSFKVITSRKDGTVVKESGSTKDYLRAVEMFQTEVSTIENSPDFYDQDAPLVLEMPINNGNGGDITNPLQLIQNDDPDSLYRDPIIAQAEAKRAKEQAAAAAAAKAAQAAEAARFKRVAEQKASEASAAKAAAEAAAARAMLEQNAEAERFARVAAAKAAAEEAAALKAAADARAFEAQAIADALALQQQAAAALEAEKAAAMEAFRVASEASVVTSGSENYNDMVQPTEIPTPTYIPEQEPGSIYIPQNLNDNPWIMEQQATTTTTAVAPAVLGQTMGLALVGLAGLAYVANRK